MSLNLTGSPVKEVLVLTSESGLSIFRVHADESTIIDDGLFSSFISAIDGFSQELDLEKLEKFRMGNRTLFLSKKSDYIFVLEVIRDVKIDYCRNLLERISQEFLNIVDTHNLDSFVINMESDFVTRIFEKSLIKIIDEVGKELLVSTP